MSDPAFTVLRKEIEAARRALLEVAQGDTEHPWHPYELKTRARNGWSADAMSLALESLIDDGLLVATDELHVQVAG